jgi:hypothetical protein
MHAPSSSLTLVIWGTCSNPSRVRFETLISRAVRGSNQVVPSFASAGFEGPWPCQFSSRLSVVFVNRGHLWRPFISNGLRGHWSVFTPFEGRIYLSQGLGPLEGLSYLVRDRAI